MMSRQHDRHERGDLPETPFDETTDLVEPDEAVAKSPLWGFRLPPLKPLLFVLAIVLAPVFGLGFGLDFSLGVLVVAMAVTSWMAWEGANELPREQGDRLRKAAIGNGVLGLLVLALLILRQVV